MKKFVLIIILFSIAKNVTAQNDKLLTWDAFQLVAKVTPKWHWVSDVSYRTIGVSLYANQYTFRTAVKRIISDKWSATLGAAVFNNRLAIDKEIHEFDLEYRLFQEVALENKLTKTLVLQNRFRPEERFFEATSKAKPFNALRLRYRIALTQKITNKIKVQLSEEYMRQLAEDKFLFQQNRLASSLIFATGKTTQLQVGYMWNKLPTLTRHYILLYLQKTISFKNKNNGKK